MDDCVPWTVGFAIWTGRDESTGAFAPIAIDRFPEEEIGLGLDVAERSQNPFRSAAEEQGLKAAGA